MENKLFLFTCVYNGSKYIKKLFESLKKQTSKNFIHYIYNDGSTDNLDSLVKEYINEVNKLDNPYKVIYENNTVNKGSLKATQNCLQKSKEYIDYNYVAWINADDWVEPNYVEEVLKECDKNNPDLIICNTHCYIDKKDYLESYFYTLKKRYKKTGKENFRLFLINKYCYGYFVFNKNFFISSNRKCELITNPIDDKFYNDAQVLFMLLGNNPKTSYIYKPIADFLKRDDAISYNRGFNLKYISSIQCLTQVERAKIKLEYDDIYNLVYMLNLARIIVKDKCTLSKKEVINQLKYYSKLHKKYSNIRIYPTHYLFLICYLILPKIIFRILFRNKGE